MKTIPQTPIVQAILADSREHFRSARRKYRRGVIFLSERQRSFAMERARVRSMLALYREAFEAGRQETLKQFGHE